MLPIITIIGQPNVGKSTLFNYLTKSCSALTADVPGVTRDRKYGEVFINSHHILLVDTGGLIIDMDSKEIEALTAIQVGQAIDEANCVLFLVDAKIGLVPADEIIARRLRKKKKRVFLVVNKADRLRTEIAQSEFYKLGFREIFVIAAISGRGIKSLMSQVLKEFPKKKVVLEKKSCIKIAMIGRPNVGKSTLINRLLGKERVIVCEQPGTTRDSIYIPCTHNNENYVLIDTAGIRRRVKIKDCIEKFSIMQSLKAMHAADVVVFLLDASQGITEQDLRLLNLIIQVGVSLIIAVNKWDRLKIEECDRVRSDINRRASFIDSARHYFISALYGTGVNTLYRAIQETYRSTHQKLTTAQLTKVLERAVAEHEPPLISGHRIRLRYAHLGGRHPLTIVLHGKKTKVLPKSYSRYLASYFRKTFNFIGVPVHIKLRTDFNPYENKS